jgi:hypothetical protein
MDGVARRVLLGGVALGATGFGFATGANTGSGASGRSGRSTDGAVD